VDHTRCIFTRRDGDHAHKDGVEQATATLGDLNDLNFRVLALEGPIQRAGTDISISRRVLHSKAG
jgi:hypothetical protein